MYSSELNLESFKNASRLSARLTSSLRDSSASFKDLAFDQQTFYLAQLIFNRASLLYQDERKAGQLIGMLNDLAGQDFYDVLELIEDDSEMRNWVQEIMDNLAAYK